MLKATPTEFTMQPGKTDSAKVLLQNESTHRIIFKIKTTRPLYFGVPCRKGIVPPGASINVTIKLHPNPDEVSSGPIEEKFLVESRRLEPTEPEPTDVAAAFGKQRPPGARIHKKVIDCVVLPRAPSAATVRATDPAVAVAAARARAGRAAAEVPPNPAAAPRPSVNAAPTAMRPSRGEGGGAEPPTGGRGSRPQGKTGRGMKLLVVSGILSMCATAAYITNPEAVDAIFAKVSPPKEQ